MNVHKARTADGIGNPLGRPWIKDLQHRRLKIGVDSSSYGTWSVDRHFSGVTEEYRFSNALNAHDHGLCGHD